MNLFASVYLFTVRPQFLLDSNKIVHSGSGRKNMVEFAWSENQFRRGLCV